LNFFSGRFLKIEVLGTIGHESSVKTLKYKIIATTESMISGILK
jgi:hypothetical protein